MTVSFRKYMHVERLGSDEVDGITNGVCYIFPKIDGTNASVWMNSEGEVKAGSRTRELTLEKDNAGFYSWVMSAGIFGDFLNDYPHLTLYGEWMVPHTLKTYRDEVWRKFYLFDVYDNKQEIYLPYEDYESLLSMEGLPVPVIAPIEIVENPNEDHLLSLLERNTYLIEDGKGSGEGIVIKNYEYENPWGRTVWAKMVRNEFKEKSHKVFGAPRVHMKGKIEVELAQTYVNRARIEKSLAKMRDEEPISRRRIPELFGRIWHDVIVEDMWEILKEKKNPTVDFGQFYRAVIEEVKRNCPELFG